MLTILNTRNENVSNMIVDVSTFQRFETMTFVLGTYESTEF